MSAILRLSKPQKLLLGAGAFTGFLGYKFYRKTQNDLTKVQVFKNFNFTRYKQDQPPLYTLKSREQHIQEMLETQYDCLIVGGGCNGSGVLLEGANRGLKCLMVEENDFSSGASSKSTKLIHGGIRYLAQVFEFSLEGHRWEKVKLLIEALHERCYMVDNAYYMNRVLPLVIPCRNYFFAMYNYVGCILYHVIYKLQPTENASTVFPFPKWMGNDELKANFPHLDFKFKYGIVYYDAQMNDTRMNMDTILTSTVNNYQKGFVGSNVLNYMRFDNFMKDESGKIIGGELRDTLTNTVYRVKANCVVNCTGVFADRIRKLDDPSVPRRVLPVQGTHAIFPIKFTSKKYALLIPKTVDDRVLFIIPWLGSTLVGTTDIKIDEPSIEPAVKYKEMEFFYRELAKIYPDLSTEYIVGSVKSKWAGLRPLVFEEIKEGQKIDSKQASRKHVIEKTQSGLISLMGGKWTIYRKMGEETIDEVMKYLKEINSLDEEKFSKRNTKYLKLLGSFQKAENEQYPLRKAYIRFFANYIQEHYSVKWEACKHLVKTYGARAFDIIKVAKDDKSLLEKIHKKLPMIRAEIVYQIRYEMAMRPNDILFRRTRIGTLDHKAMFEVLPAVVDIFSQEMKWDETKKKEEWKRTLEEMEHIMRLEGD